LKLPRRKFLYLAAASSALPTVSRNAWAQAWPTSVVRLIIPLPSGGGADTVGRILANRLSEIWHRQVIVENKSGGGGNLAYEAVAHAAPDGYTILMASGPPALKGLLYSSLDYKPQTDFAPVTLIGKFPDLLVVPNTSPARSLQEFIAYAKANPGKISYASTGVGSLPHLAGELLKRTTGIEMTHVPYRGVAAGAMNDLVAGRIDAMFNGLASLIQPVRAGQVRALALTSAERFPTAPEFSTFVESGVPDFDVSAHYGLYVPATTPPLIVKTIHADTVAILAEPAVKAKFEPLGTTLVGSTPSELAAADQADVERFGPLIKALNISGE
jgi:tripartite-type tricarboxylate transporter receptor subunit TctC